MTDEQRDLRADLNAQDDDGYGWSTLSRARNPRPSRSELEAEFAFGVVRQLFERRLLGASMDERAELLTGPGAAARALLWSPSDPVSRDDSSFSVLHGLYWLDVNLSTHRPLLIAVDDVHCADTPSLRWLAYLAARLEGPANDELCDALNRMSGGNPFYLAELLRAAEATELASTDRVGDEVAPLAGESVSAHVARRIRRLDTAALRLAQALAVLGDDSELRHAAALADVDRLRAPAIPSG